MSSDSKIYSKLLEESDKQIWNDFVNESPWSTILQFWQWGDTKETEGWTPYRIAVFDDQKIIVGAQILVKPAPVLGNYLYVPHGPVFQTLEDFSRGWDKLHFHLLNFAKAHNCFVIELEPMLGVHADENELSAGLVHYTNTDVLDHILNKGYMKTNRNMQPKYKLLYDLTKSEEELLGLMKKNTRYNVKYAMKKGVQIEESSPKDKNIQAKLRRFYDLVLDMQKRSNGYPVRPFKTFTRLFEAFADTDNIALFEAKYEDDLITTNISERTKTWSSSFYAGSNRLHSNVKAPYLLRWESIRSAKKYGSKVYDFWGFIPESDQHKGYSDTKLSFGGIRIDTYGLLALPIDSNKFFIWDKIIPLRGKIIELLRKIKR